MDDYVLRALPPRLRRSVTRRQSPRVTVDGRATIDFASGDDEPAELFDISAHGFSIWTSCPATKGEVRLFRLAVPGQPDHWLYAVAAHIGPIPPVTPGRFFSGWFVESEASQCVLEETVEELTSDARDASRSEVVELMQHA